MSERRSPSPEECKWLIEILEKQARRAEAERKRIMTRFLRIILIALLSQAPSTPPECSCGLLRALLCSPASVAISAHRADSVGVDHGVTLRRISSCHLWSCRRGLSPRPKGWNSDR